MYIWRIGKDEDRLDRGNAPLGAKESGAKGSTWELSKFQIAPQKETRRGRAPKLAPVK